MKVGEIAERLACRLEGDASIEITGVAGIEAAEPGQLTFLANPRYRKALAATRASAVIIETGAALPPGRAGHALAVLRSQSPQLDFARGIELFHQGPHYAPSIHPTAVVSSSARIGPGAHVGPYCFVDDDVRIGSNVVLHSFVTIYRGVHIGNHFFAHSHVVVREGCRIGDRVILQNGVVVGSDGFGFAKRPDGRWHKIFQAGITVIEDDVEIQANTCVDRATVGETRIRRGAKIDDLVLVGHAAKVGEDTLLCGQVGLAGSTSVGNRCILAGQVGSVGHLHIGDGAIVTAQSGVPDDVPPGAVISGSPAVENKRWLRTVAALKHVPELQRMVRELRAEIECLKNQKAR